MIIYSRAFVERIDKDRENIVAKYDYKVFKGVCSKNANEIFNFDDRGIQVEAHRVQKIDIAF